MKPGLFKIPARGTIAIPDESFSETAWELDGVFRGYRVAASAEGVDDPVVIRLRPGIKSQGYCLKIEPDKVTIEAASPVGAFYAAQTLVQVAEQSTRGRLPCLNISDWPDFIDRGIYYDVCRGRVPKIERLIEMAEILASYKINHLQLYMEHTFRFRAHPEIGKNASPLTAEDILVLDEVCRQRHIELVPSLASFGHLASVLLNPKYRHLAEDLGTLHYVAPEAASMPDWQRRPGWSLAPANPDSYKFLESLFAEFLPLFSSKRFNVCCDETWDLGMGQSYQLAKRIGKGRLYLDHMLRLHELAAKHGKKIMFWGDIIRHYPELIDQLPSDITLLDWGYDHNHNFAGVADFRRSGLEFFACPGTNSWCSMFARMHAATANIHGFAVAARENGARGLMTTDWGDNGHFNFMEYSWHGYLIGAEQAWNTGADRSDYTARFCDRFLKVRSAELTAAIMKLGDVVQTSPVGSYENIWQRMYYAVANDPVFGQGKVSSFVSVRGKIGKQDVNYSAALGRKTERELLRIRSVVARYEKKPGVDPFGVLEYWLFAVDTLLHAARKLAVLGAGGENRAAQRRKLRSEMARLLKRFERLWMARNRRSEIRVTLRRYRKAMRSL